MVLLNCRSEGGAAGFISQWGLALFIVLIVVVIACIIVYIFILQWIYKDAVKRDLNGELWLIILLLAPILGIIIYFLVRKTKERSTA